MQVQESIEKAYQSCTYYIEIRKKSSITRFIDSLSNQRIIEFNQEKQFIILDIK